MQDKEGETLKKKKTGKILFLEVQTVLMCLTCKEKPWTASLTCIRCLVPRGHLHLQILAYSI